MWLIPIILFACIQNFNKKHELSEANKNVETKKNFYNFISFLNYKDGYLFNKGKIDKKNIKIYQSYYLKSQIEHFDKFFFKIQFKVKRLLYRI